MDKKKTVALIAHDNKKPEIVEWAKAHAERLKNFNLCGTGTTAKLIEKNTGLNVKPFLSGPLGGDQQIGAGVAEGRIDAVIFFCDPLQAQPHDPDVKALLRIAVVCDIPIATNKATADCVIMAV
ncbi:MAG: methylglyoxal synthase [Clostridiales bacterium]|jgi:methylglyoxal synthase|nr:methylglyoxal synthase [Clostridiales bacterium]